MAEVSHSADVAVYQAHIEASWGAQRMSDAQYAVEGRLIDIVDEAWARDTLPVEGTALDGHVGLL